MSVTENTGDSPTKEKKLPMSDKMKFTPARGLAVRS